MKIIAKNFDEDHKLAVIFDSRERGTSDPDLEGPSPADLETWEGGGNLAPDTILGNLLIVQENETGLGSGDGIADDPDDEGSRPAGLLMFSFTEYSISSFGFDLVDVESATAEMGYVKFFNKVGTTKTLLAKVDFEDFVTSGNPFFDSTVAYGDNSANRIAPMTATKLSTLPGVTTPFTSFNFVKIKMGGSSAIDNVNYATPEPSTLLLFGIGALGLFVYGRRHRKQSA